MASAWLFLKGKNYTPIDAIEEVKDVIKTITNNYNLDTTKIYLNGECVGGMRALLLAEKCQNLFSGIVVRAPITMRGEGDEIPVNFVQNLYNIPICIKHGKDDNEVPIQETREFVLEAQKHGQKIKLIEDETGHLELSRDERKYIFAYLDSLKTSSKPNKFDVVK